MTGRLVVTRNRKRALVAIVAAAALGGAAFGGVAATTGAEPDPAPSGESQRSVSPEDQLRFSARRWSTDFTKARVPLGEFVLGGPSKDGIPAIDDPDFTSVEAAAGWIEPREPVIELVLEGEARIYPIQILIWHEIVNDEFHGRPIAVTFCPLCNTALVFDRTVDDRVLEFGVSGILRNSDLVMFDRATESWWQQFGGEALVGEFAGTELEQFPAAIAAFEDAAATHPDAAVLSRDTGFIRPYGQNPYPGYDNVDLPPFFRVENRDRRIAPRERVVFVQVEGEAVAVPFPFLEARETIEVELGGQRLTVIWKAGVTSTLDDTDIYSPLFPANDREEVKVTGSADVVDSLTGERVAFDTPFWFAVAAFRPDVQILDR